MPLRVVTRVNGVPVAGWPLLRMLFPVEEAAMIVIETSGLGCRAVDRRNAGKAVCGVVTVRSRHSRACWLARGHAARVFGHRCYPPSGVERGHFIDCRLR